jgi:hypothetical protein
MGHCFHDAALFIEDIIHIIEDIIHHTELLVVRKAGQLYEMRLT